MRQSINLARDFFRTTGIFFACLWLSTPAGANQETAYFARYLVDIDVSLETLQVQVCFNEQVPANLYSSDDGAARHLSYIEINGEKSRLVRVSSDRISLDGLKPGGCLQYKTNIKSGGQGRRSWMRQRNISGDNVRVSPASWLWLPKKSEVDGPVIISFTHPPAYAVSAPWELIERTDSKTSYSLGNSPYHWNAYTVFGKLHTEEIAVPGAVLRLSVMKGQPEANYADVREWIKHGAEAITMAYGRFPLPSPQIVVVPTGRSSRGAVPFGHILRGGGTASHLYIDQTRPISQHIKDWTLVHELSHMLHPYMGDAGSWMAEGLASYYQNVIQARAGVITHHRAWQKLHEGFQRGIKQTYEGVTLEDASTNRGWSGTMRVYWSGAAISLLADLELRRRGDSMDNVLSRFQACCLPADELWPPYEFMNKMDELSRSTIFTDLYNQYVISDIFPELEQAYEDLGIYIVDGTVTFKSDPGAKRLRQSIMTAPAMTKQAGMAPEKFTTY